ADPRSAPQIWVEYFLDIGFPIHIALVKSELARFLLVGVIRRADVAQEVGCECAIDIRAHRFDRYVYSGQSDVVLGELRYCRKINILYVGVGDFGVGAIMFL